MTISGDIYRRIGRASAGAVSIVAAYSPSGGPSGEGQSGAGIAALTVSSFVTLSFDPPLVMFAIQHNADSYPVMMRSKAFGVSLLNDGQAAIAQRLAGKGPEKIRDTPFEQGHALEVPMIPGSLAQIECLTHQIVLSGDHAIVVGSVEHARTQPGNPLLYFARQFGRFVSLSDA